MWTWIVIGVTLGGMSGVIYLQHERIGVLNDKVKVSQQETQNALRTLADQQRAVEAMLDIQKKARQNALDSLKRSEGRVRVLTEEITLLREPKPVLGDDCENTRALVDSVL